jgi:hypothetical protein
MNRIAKTSIYAIVIGIVLTLISFFYGYGKGGGGGMGFPFSWLDYTVIPSFTGYTIYWSGLILDILVWSVVSFLVLFALFRKKK